MSEPFLDFLQACVPGANQYANLPPFLQAMKLMGTEAVYEVYDMDKLLKTACRGDYNEKCIHCENYRKYREGQEIFCEKKSVKRQNIQRGCLTAAACLRGQPGKAPVLCGAALLLGL